MRLTPTIRAFIILAFLAWLISAVIPLLEPPKHIRHTDAATDERPPELASPTTAPVITPPTADLSEAQVVEILRRQGYYDVGAVRRQEDGSWTAQAARGAGGAKAEVRVGPDGRVTQP